MNKRSPSQSSGEKTDDLAQLVKIYNLLLQLVSSLSSSPRNKSIRIAVRYTNLREEAKCIVKDPKFDRLVPKASWLWFLTPSEREVRQYAQTLITYLDDYVRLDPDLASRIRRQREPSVEQEFQELQQRNAALEAGLRRLEKRLQDKTDQLKTAQEQLQSARQDQPTDALLIIETYPFRWDACIRLSIGNMGD